MAFKLPITNSNIGMGFTESYARITNIWGSLKGDLQIQIEFYASQQARDEGANSIRQEHYYAPVKEIDEIASGLTGTVCGQSLYKWLRQNVELFAQATDC